MIDPSRTSEADPFAGSSAPGGSGFAEPGGSPAAVGHPEGAAVALFYDELRVLAHRQRTREGIHATLHTTELVHEAYLRLAGDERIVAKGRAYFFGAAARAMRRVLVDAARRRGAAKRGSDPVQVTLGNVVIPMDGHAADLLDLDRALSALEEEHPRLARVVELRFFGGLSVDETAESLDVSPRTVKGDWALARAWLHEALEERRAADSAPGAGP
ncbi:MAG: RNA polymerase subunit sigma [Gemmatimonadales bacterium]|nr:MAG: RNA polymerase subunit sigma [Gemmatimonadales bacterium]